MIERKKELETLEYYDTASHLEAIKSGNFEMYENEYELIKDSLGLPVQFMQLGELEQQMVMLYIDPDYVEPHSGKKTKNNIFISFLASYQDENVVASLFKYDYVHAGFDKEGNELKKAIKVPNPHHYHKYLRLKALSTNVWHSSNLKEIAKSMRELVENGGYRDEEVLERKILDDAMSDERDSFTMQNRKIASEIKGMKKPTALMNINLFNKGGKEMTEIIVAESGNEAYDIIPKEVVVDDE